MIVRDDLRSRDPTSPGLTEMNDAITRIANEHKSGDSLWRRCITRQILQNWITIKAIDDKSTPKDENEAITFDDSQVTSPKQISNYFNRQFTTSKLGRHTCSRDTQLVSREIKRKSLTSAVTFTTDQVTKGISSCSNTQAFGPDKLSIFHIKHLGSRGIEYLTALFNDSVTSCRIPLIWKSPQSRNQARTALSALLIGLSRSSVRQRKLWGLSYFQPSTATCYHPQTNTVSEPDTTTSALLQLTSDIATCFNQRKPPHRTVGGIRYSQPQRTVI